MENLHFHGCYFGKAVSCDRCLAQYHVLDADTQTCNKITGLHIFVSDCPHRDASYNWVQGLGSTPDVPHAVDASSRKTEGNGVGVTKEPPVRVAETGNGWMHGVGGGVSDVYSGGSDASISLCFSIGIIGQEMTWETLLIGTTLFIEIPSDILPVGSKERYHITMGHFSFWISLPLSALLSPKFGVSLKISHKVKSFFVWTQCFAELFAETKLRTE